MTALTRKATILITAIAAVGVLIFYRLADISAAWMPKCPLHHLTGLRCPGCGTQRALQAQINAGTLLILWGILRNLLSL